VPHTNPFFSNTTGYTGEVNLFDDLVREQIKIYGVDLMFMPRRMLNLDDLLHESTKNAFELAMPIPSYIKTFDGYDNGLEALTKFGVRNADEITIQISRSEFTAHYGPFVKSYYNSIAGRPGTSELPELDGETAQRPKEGDLIYFPFDDGLFEIKYVQLDSPFFQLGKNYVFELQCEKFEYSGATMDTGYDQIDDTTEEIDYYSLQLDLIDGVDTFMFKERVWIYSVDTEIAPRLLEDEDVTSGVDVYIADDNSNPRPFSLYKDPGFTHKVDRVEGTVQYWNREDKILTLNDLSDNDPTQDNEDGIVDVDLRDMIINKFDEVLVIGQHTGAKWYSKKAGTRRKAFDDEHIIQKEFDEIKVVDDPRDINPFGFV